MSATPIQEPPSHFLDPATYDVMQDPVVCTDGRTYDRSTVDKLDASPFTRKPIKILVENVDIRGAIFEAYPELAKKFEGLRSKRSQPPPPLSQPQAEALASDTGALRRSQGNLTFESGTRYVGEVVGNIASGQGKFFYPDGSSYTGFVANNRPEGAGILVGPPSHPTTVEAWFRHGNAEGSGTVFYPNGGVFRGRLHNGFAADGVYSSPRVTYWGTFLEGKRHGEGFERREGEYFQVHYDRGVKVKESRYDMGD